MIIASDREREILRESGRRLSLALEAVLRAVQPGAATAALDRIAEERIRDLEGGAVFKGYRTHPKDRPYPGAVCISINDEVVHGIPREGRTLADGDIVGIDLGLRWPASDGLITDMAITVGVGAIDDESKRLLRATRRALEQGIKTLRSGMRLGDLGSVIQKEIEKDGFGVIEELVGHGVGRNLHEHPYVPNFGAPGSGERIREGSVLAIEPMAALGSPLVRIDRDGWTWRTADGSRAAHFEHTVIVGAAGSEAVTRFPEI